jgi:hypothetical protein
MKARSRDPCTGPSHRVHLLRAWMASTIYLVWPSDRL